MSSDRGKEGSDSPQVEIKNQSSHESQPDIGEAENIKKPWYQRWWRVLREPGSVWQIIIAATLAIAIGMAVTSSVEEVPTAAVVLVGIPGTLWLRCLKGVVLPLIVVSMILAVQRLREMARGGLALARWTIGYYLSTTLIAIIHSTIMVALVWKNQFTEVGAESLATDTTDDELIKERSKYEVHDIVLQLFESLVPANIVNALATDSLLAVIITAMVVGYLLPSGSAILKAIVEVEKIIMIIITWLIHIAPIGIFFLIMPNLFKLDIGEIGYNLGILIGSAMTGMATQLVIVYPIIYFAFMRENAYTYWFKNAPAWLTAWGTASSAATMPVTMKCMKTRGIPDTVTKFAIPLGTLVNMDGTAIYFPVSVVFLAATQGHELAPTDYVIIVLLATLASIGTTPIPSSSLVLVVLIANSVNVEITGMYGVILAIDWFLDRFRTVINVSGDMFGCAIVARMTGIKDSPEDRELEVEPADNTARV
ncbi:hypothetical protein AJ80_06699 [Polytolypa hystricis UAMH7299]|uniref:Amino acid transporter n=1 Tax=Polytolypa hystricis (strain UAMH7299) TaxID=1447883 RepID=A0A2B7XVE9_POLH7|nr:hypothetical protein AJ80_06699 [Polytolypa hystricis UAMH7299]